MVAGFLPLSSFVMFMSHRRLFIHLCGLNPDSPAASTALDVDSRFVPASLPVDHQK